MTDTPRYAPYSDQRRPNIKCKACRQSIPDGCLRLFDAFEKAPSCAACATKNGWVPTDNEAVLLARQPTTASEKGQIVDSLAALTRSVDALDARLGKLEMTMLSHLSKMEQQSEETRIQVVRIAGLVQRLEEQVKTFKANRASRTAPGEGKPVDAVNQVREGSILANNPHLRETNDNFSIDTLSKMKRIGSIIDAQDLGKKYGFPEGEE